MSKGQSATTGVVMMLAAGAFLRPSLTSTPGLFRGLPVVHSAAAAIADTKARTEGPWKASCQYWAPVREQNEDSDAPEAKVPLTVVQSEPDSDAPAGPAPSAKGVCEGSKNAWGIPARLPDASAPEITSLIAVVPDPERGNLGLDFDRTIDALLQAASDNGYVGSYFWLPWKTGEPRNPKDTSTTAEPHTESPTQPGLIILKPGGEVDRTDREQSFRSVVYVFLVAATPTQGVAGDQLRNAFAYEEQLLALPGAHTTLSLRDQQAPNSKSVADGKLNPAPQDPSPVISAPKSGPQRLSEMDLLLFNYSGSAASLREGILKALGDPASPSPLQKHGIRKVSISGSTSTALVGDLLDSSFHGTSISFHSFEPDTSVEEAEVTDVFQDEHRSCEPIAFVAEDGTVFGSSASHNFLVEQAKYGMTELGTQKDDRVLASCGSSQPLILKFPRGISLLRNAAARESEKAAKDNENTLSPYLHFSLRDGNAEDSVPHFAAEDTPLSQEAQLMAIGRRLAHAQVRTIAISSSSVLDEMYLAQFLHRACPDARLVFLGGGDLLIERDIESAQYIGAITFSPYSLVSLDHSAFTPHDVRAFASAQSEAFYNAASFVFWNPGSRPPRLVGYPAHQYGRDFMPTALRPILWATTVGRDGYYPLGILNPCPSSTEATLPDITLQDGSTQARTSSCNSAQPGDVAKPFEPGTRVYPSMAWFILCIGTGLLCVGHSSILLIADFWSPVTRDLAIESSDMPRRRAVYVNIATAMLFCMAFVVAYPLLPVFRSSSWSSNAAVWAIFTLIAAVFSLFATAQRTCPHIAFTPEDFEIPDKAQRVARSNELKPSKRRNYYLLLHTIAGLTVVVVPALWVVICGTNRTLGTQTFAGLFFSYRCLHPESGVSPLPPILFLLFGWYLWGVCQTLRLRLSFNSRPQLPCALNAGTPYPLYVSEETLSRCNATQSPCLYRNITCLLITREVIRRFFLSSGKRLDAVLVLGYFVLFLIAVLLVHVQSLDHFLWNAGFWPTFYEFLIRGLFFPLMMIALTGWVRLIFIWNSLRRGMLEPLERLPIRYAFNRLKGVAWMTMLRQGGLTEYWRDMARSTESMRQMVHTPDLEVAIKAANPADWRALLQTNDALGAHIHELQLLAADRTPRRRRTDTDMRKRSREFLVGDDVPSPKFRDELNLMAAIERGYAHFCELLLDSLLIPYWNTKRTGLVEGEPAEMMPAKAEAAGKDAKQKPPTSTPTQNPDELCIHLAEEFLAIRYVSVIRAVLVNLRYTMIFVSMAFVVSILAWNSYPFRPRVWVDCLFTAVLLVLGAGVVRVLAQMYRNPILSRITDTSANELGVDFYIRLATLGGVPVLTWLASQFPVLGNTLFHFIKPGLDFAK